MVNMKVIRPTNNALSRGYSSSHKGYDFKGLNLPDEVRAGMSGTIIERVDLYATNWTNNGTLTTKDYGNYIKIKHDDGTFELHAHLKVGSSLILTTKVTAGQVVARIGNTGNSTGPHLHSEYRTANNVNTEATFEDYVEPLPPAHDYEKELEEVRASRDKWKNKTNELEQTLDTERKDNSKTLKDKNTQIETLQSGNSELTLQLTSNTKTIVGLRSDLESITDRHTILQGEYSLYQEQAVREITALELVKKAQADEIVELKARAKGKLSGYSRLDLFMAIFRR